MDIKILSPFPLGKLTCVTGSFMIKTSVTLPKFPKYSFNLSADVCQLKPPTNNFPGAESMLFGVDRPDEPECDAVVIPLLITVVVAVDATAMAAFCCACCCCCGVIT